MRHVLIASFLSAALSAPAASQEMMPLFHNGSRALFTRDNGRVEIRYETPRKGLPVTAGTLLFEGKYDGRGSYTGTAYIFKRGCEPTPYAVAGKDSGPGIVLMGMAPHRDPHSCAIVGDIVGGKNSRLVFEYESEN